MLGTAQQILQEGMGMVALEQRVHPHPQVVDTELDEGEVVLLHLESKTYYSLNPTGRDRQGLKQGLTLNGDQPAAPRRI